MTKNKTEELLRQMVALQTLLIKNISNQSKAELIKDLNTVGLRPKEIATLLGETSNSVRVALSRAKNKGSKKGTTDKK